MKIHIIGFDVKPACSWSCQRFDICIAGTHVVILFLFIAKYVNQNK